MSGRLWLLLLVLAFGCSNTPTAPSAAFNLAGEWTGTWTFASGGAMVTDAVTLTLTQSGTTATGTWIGSSGPRGTVEFAVGATNINGTATITQTLLTGQTCATTTALTGSANATTINYTFGVLAVSGLCTWSQSHEFRFTK